MKDINKEERSDFERSWAEAFENVEETPDEHLWHSIDASLANRENQKYKRRILFYQMVTAASIALALLFSYLSFNIVSTNSGGLAQREEQQTSEGNQVDTDQDQNEVDSAPLGSVDKVRSEEATSALAGNSSSQDTPTTTNTTEGQQETGLSLSVSEKSSENNASVGESVEASSSNVFSSGIAENQDAEASEGFSVLENGQLNQVENNLASLDENVDKNLGEMSALGIDGQFFSRLMDAPEIYAIPGYKSIWEDDKEDKAKKPVLWAGLDLGSSVFDPNFENGSNFNPKSSPALSNAQFREAPQVLSKSQTTDPGMSYSLGINFGLRVSEKWIIQSGVQYASRSASTNSNTAVMNSFGKTSTPYSQGFLDISNEGGKVEEVQALSQEYEMVNNFKFASFPLKAGYKLIDGKFGLMLNAGVAADIFLSNTLSESSDKLDDVTVDAGSDSPFREVNFSGLIGAEVFYELSKKYHLTLEPNYTIALNSLTKSGEGFKSTPQIFGLSAGLRYFIK